MPQGYPWGMPENFMLEGYNQDAQVSQLAQAAAASAPPVVHITPTARNEIHCIAPISVNVIPFVNDEVYHPIPPPSEGLGLYDRMDDFQDQFDKTQREMKALRGKKLFGQNVNDMCLVPNVKIPANFKVP